MPAGAGTLRYEKLELWLGTANWHRGFCLAPSAPAGDKPLASRSFRPHYVPLSPPLWIPAFAGVTKSVAGVCFRTNRSSRLPPAHQGMKTRGCDFMRPGGTGDSARPLLGPSGGQAPALHSPSPPLWIPAFAGVTHGGRNDECGSSGMRALSGSSNTIFVPMTGGDLVYDYGVNVRGVKHLLEQR